MNAKEAASAASNPEHKFSGWADLGASGRKSGSRCSSLTCLYISGWPVDLPEIQLQNVFDMFGPVEFVEINKHRGLPCTTYAFVGLGTEMSAKHAVAAMDGTAFGDSTLSVILASFNAGRSSAYLRLCENRAMGTLSRWSDYFGWIVPDQPISHPTAPARGGRIYVALEDINGPGELCAGARVSFVPYVDCQGIGACEVRVESQEHPKSKASSTLKASKHAYNKVQHVEKLPSQLTPGACNAENRLSFRVDVWDWPPGLNVSDFRQTFERFGHVVATELYPAEKDDARAHGIVSYSALASAEAAAESMDGTLYGGVPLQVTLSRDSAASDVAGSCPDSTEHGHSALSEKPWPQGRLSGRVRAWLGKHGWIVPDEPLDHPLAAKNNLQVYVGARDIQGTTELFVGDRVSFCIYEDPRGIGACEVLVEDTRIKFHDSCSLPHQGQDCSSISPGMGRRFHGRHQGCVSSWGGESGWISPDVPISHPLAVKQHGLIFVGAQDLEDASQLFAGDRVAFVLYSDSSWVGAAEVRRLSHMTDVRAPAQDNQWWHALEKTCPISEMQMLNLEHEPFGLVADNDCAQSAPSTCGLWGSWGMAAFLTDQPANWFNGFCLACFIVACDQYIDPVNSRALSRGECSSLDDYLAENNLPSVFVADAFDLAKAIGAGQASQLDQERSQSLQHGARVLLGQLCPSKVADLLRSGMRRLTDIHCDEESIGARETPRLCEGSSVVDPKEARLAARKDLGAKSIAVWPLAAPGSAPLPQIHDVQIGAKESAGESSDEEVLHIQKGFGPPSLKQMPGDVMSLTTDCKGVSLKSPAMHERHLRIRQVGPLEETSHSAETQTNWTSGQEIAADHVLEPFDTETSEDAILRNESSVLDAKAGVLDTTQLEAHAQDAAEISVTQRVNRWGRRRDRRADDS